MCEERCRTWIVGSICSMEVRVKRSNADEEETFHFVIKSPPKSSFIKMMHKFTRPFFNGM